MTLHRYRRTGAPLALLTCGVYLYATLRSTAGWAQTAEASAGAHYDRASRAALSQEVSRPAGGASPAADAAGGPSESTEQVQSALGASPGGGGVSPSAAAMPSGPATQLGMGESFTMQLSTGAVGYSVPITMPGARGHARATLSLSYSSGAGLGLAGVGWSIGAPAIERQTDRGVPTYDDRASWHANQDRFTFAGSELVPICTVASGACTGALSGEVFPTWANGWQYFRSRIEGTFARTFWSADHKTWRVQGKDGTTMEFGVPLDGTAYEGALERNPDATSQIYRWHLVRQYDTQTGTGGQPVNTIYYRYATDGNVAYLTDIVDTSPASAPTSTNLALYAHHTALTYAVRPDVAVSYRPGYRSIVQWRVSNIDVTSKPFTGGSGAARELVRRYRLGYDLTAHRSILTSVAMEGRCPTAVVEDGTQRLPATSCPQLPALRFEYQKVTSTAAPVLDARGLAYSPVDVTVRTLPQSPSRSVDEPDTGLLDVNGDGLQDVVATTPGSFGGKHGLFINGAGMPGVVGFGVASTMPVIPTGTVTDPGVLSLHSANVAAMDLDADGMVDLVHMPAAKRYSIFSVRPDGLGGFQWAGREISTASQQDVKINFAQDARNTRVIDVNGDGLVDVVYSTPTQLQTFFSLGRYPGGEGQFGTASWTSATTAQIGNDPVVFCPPWSGTPVRFSDPDVMLADMNGDGLGDIVRVRDGQIFYWPGRGNGFWGTGALNGCSGGAQFATERHIAMDNPPRFGTYDPGSLLLNDVNGDGLADLVVVRSTGVEMFLNDGGSGWTGVTRIDGTPFRAAGRTHVRLTDIDGSGTPDILWGLAGDYRYIDLTGGVTPDLLVKVKNGLGQTLDLEYTSSTKQMLAAAAAGKPWSTFAPTTMPVLSRSIQRDNLNLVGRAAGVYAHEYTYRDPVFEGRQREFRGFSDVVVKDPGDANSPTSYQRTVFQLGECSLQFVGTSSDVCSPGQRWQDNWREALKGLPVLSESYDDNGVYESTEHTTFELRQYYAGLDGRRVVAALPVTKEHLLYDKTSFDKVTSAVNFDEVLVTIPGLAHTEVRSVTQRASAGTARIKASTVYDSVGNVNETVHYGCTSGCPAGVDETITTRSEFNRPAADPTGWLWRETRSYVFGSVNTALRKEALNSYDSFGNLTATYHVLSGTLPLTRRHETTGAAIAPAPTNQSGGSSTAVQVLVQGPTYDTFGNATFNRAAAGRCTNRDYDTDYKHLPVVERIAGGALDTNTQCGATLFAHTVTYDRGTAQVIDSLDARNQPERYAFDGFGRLTSITGTDPARPGFLATQPTVKVSYQLPANPDTTPYTITDVLTQDGATPNVASCTERISVADGLGRNIVTLQQADSAAGDLGDWVAEGYATYDARGHVARAYLPVFYTGTIANALAGPPAGTDYKSQQYDAFGATTMRFGFDHVVTSLVKPHAMTIDAYDAADVLATVHQNTYLTAVADGHGRTVRADKRIKVGSAIETHSTLTTYLPTNEPLSITQRRPGSPDVVRTMQYDTMGRLVLNLEPNTTNGTTQAWRYAYNDASGVVGTSDARGCGVNNFYDMGGRLIAEDRSPCLASQPAYTAPNLTTGDGTELFIRYDTADPDGANIVDAAGRALTIDASLLLGRTVSSSSLGSKTLYRYDARGQITGVGARIQKPGVAASALASRYAPRWYVRMATFDAVGRLLSSDTGAAVSQLMGSDGTSAARRTYTKRGAVAQYGSSYGVLARQVNLADGRPKTQTMGDAAATQRSFTYDANLRFRTMQTLRSAAPLWSSPPPGSPYQSPLPTDDPTRQLLLENRVFTYDEVGNLVKDEDNRTASDWPATAKPVTRTFEYDDFYRLTRTTYAYPGGTTDSWKSPFAAEDSTPTLQPKPGPRVSFAARLTEEKFQYDYLGNTTQATDDQQAFWDRSTGDRTFGTATAGPNRILSASNRTLAPTSTRKGDLSAGYDLTGNTTGLVVRRDGSCLPAGSSCWQRFAYEWDEVGQLTRAQRWDLTTTERTNNGALTQVVPPRAANADLRYAYDGSGTRILKTAVDAAGNQVHSLYIFPSLEVRRTTFSTTTNDYIVDANTASVNVAAGPVTARVFYSAVTMPSASAGGQHVFLRFSDRLGSSMLILDYSTGELVEAMSYQSYGATETDYRPNRWAGSREPYQFGGKEEDIEVGLAYFGARYFSPYLGVWLSPDPVTVHEGGSDANPYQYVSSSPLMGVDPDGREPITIGTIIVILVIAAVVAGGTAAAMDYYHTGEVDPEKVAIAAGIGVVAAGAAIVTGGAAAGAVGGSGLAASVIGGAAGGIAGGVTAYGLSVAARGGTGFSWQDLGESALIGGVSGAIGGFAGQWVPKGSVGWAGVTGATTAAAGYGISAAIHPESASWQAFALSVGGGLAASVATATFTGGRQSGSAPKDKYESKTGYFTDTASGTKQAFDPEGSMDNFVASGECPYMPSDGPWHPLTHTFKVVVADLREVGVDLDAILVNSSTPAAGQGGITFWDHVFLAAGHSNADEAKLLTHEMVHSPQWWRLGPLFFVIRYLAIEYPFFKHHGYGDPPELNGVPVKSMDPVGRDYSLDGACDHSMYSYFPPDE
jgi:RHS repeat-associated protein